jgi:PIN domain nuclease of toxin-antitoxin system
LDWNAVKLLLDTHTFIWWDSEPAKLSATALALCSDPTNELLLSVTSLWEMQIKHTLGKLSLRLPLNAIVAHQQDTNGVVVLPILPTHIFALDGLPTPHKDPFDRLLVAQANSEGATLISADTIFAAYPVRIAW